MSASQSMTAPATSHEAQLIAADVTRIYCEIARARSDIVATAEGVKRELYRATFAVMTVALLVLFTLLAGLAR